MKQQLAGAEALSGTYPFTLERCVKSYRINKYLHEMIIPAHRTLFRDDQETSFEQAELSQEERSLIRELDWRGLIHYGVIFFMLEKLGAVVGISNLHIYAAMRGQTLEEFQQTRNAPGALYSVAGQETTALNWDRQA
jgi:gallate dioxygenase